jgi:hypothetical protein
MCNRTALEQSELAHCHYCLRTFEAGLIRDWVIEPSPNSDNTALCPFCNIDMVIPFEK